MAKVLLVEDDNNLREIYEARLQAEGYEIAAAQDGEQALVVAKDFKPDLVISDVMMPKISGFEMLDILRNTEGLEHTRVIMLTALSQAEDKSRADQLGADRYLVKSQVTLEDIIKAAHDILGDGEEPAAPTPAAAAPVATPAPDMAVATPPPAAPAPTADAPTDSTTAQPSATPIAVATPPATQPSEPPADTAAAAEPPTTAEEAIAQAVEVESNIPSAPQTPANDQLLAEAAHKLDASTPSPTGPVTSDASSPAAPEVVVPTVPPPTEEPADEPVAAPEPATASNDDDTSGGSSKRVIQPLTDSDGAKPTLEELLAREEAKEVSGSNGTPGSSTAPASSTETTPSAADTVTTPKNPSDINPHDIAL